MSLDTTLSFDSQGSAFERGLSLDTVRSQAPAVFAASPHESLSHRYGFIPTRRILEALMNVGFVPINVQQTHTRTQSAAHARHLIRLRRRMETVQLNDAVPEIAFLNSHDGTTRFVLRLAVFRGACTNGLIVSQAAFPQICVAHRGNVLDQIVTAALELAEQFDSLAAQVERMQTRFLEEKEQMQLARRALALRFLGAEDSGIAASQVLRCRRIEDEGSDLWRVFNRVQENVMAGGLSRRSTQGRLVRTRRITAIRRQLTMNEQLWAEAALLLTT